LLNGQGAETVSCFSGLRGPDMFQKGKYGRDGRRKTANQLGLAFRDGLQAKEAGPELPRAPQPEF